MMASQCQRGHFLVPGFWKLIWISCILAFKGESVVGAKHLCDQTQWEEKGTRGFINPCQRRPNYLSPCANKRCPGQPVGGGRKVVREVREGCQRRRSLTPITLSLISPPRPAPHYSSNTGTGPQWLSTELHVEVWEWESCKERVPYLHFRFPWHFFSEDFFPFLCSSQGSHLFSTAWAWCFGSPWKFMSMHLFLCTSEVCVCVFMSSMWRGGGVLAVASGLWEADCSASLTHSQARLAQGFQSITSPCSCPEQAVWKVRVAWNGHY